MAGNSRSGRRCAFGKWRRPSASFSRCGRRNARPFTAGTSMWQDAILEPKPVQKPRPPVMIAGGGEQLTLRAVARLADACNVGGDPEMVRHKLAVLRGHCDAARRDYDAIEKTHNNSWLLARDEAAVVAKRRAAGQSGAIAGLCRYGIRGDRSDRPIPRRRGAAADQQRLPERRRNSRTARLRRHAAFRIRGRSRSRCTHHASDHRLMIYACC